MLIRQALFSALPSLLLVISSAQAGTIANNEWTATTCGPVPAEAKLDLKNPDAYNKSVEAVSNFRIANHAYLDCVIKEANADIQTVNKSATTFQQKVVDADNKIQDDIKAADKKFGK